MPDGRRRLAAILAADVVGYSRLMEADEEGTIAALRAHRTSVIDAKLAAYHGRVANTAGDSLLIEFASAVDALRCALDIQSDIAATNESVPADRRLEFRIGINVGDVVAQGDDLLGDGVNVAARLESLAHSGGICLSRSARDQVRDRMDVDLEDLGEITVKNISRPVRAFRVRGVGHAQETATPTKSSARTIALAAALACLLLVGGGGVWWWQTPDDTTAQGERQPHKASIAVLPFSNLSDDKGQGYFADGITEDIITDLSKVKGLYVTSRSATLRYRNSTDDPRNIAQALSVANILAGSIRRAGDKIRLTAKLIDGESGRQLWAERFDRQSGDIFAIQDEIADRVVAQLSSTLDQGAFSRTARAYTPNVEAYDLYIHGRAKRIPPTPKNLAAALEMFNQAIALDPQFAGGYAGAAYALVLQYASTPTNDDRTQGYLTTAITLAEKAVALDPTFGPAWGSLGEAYSRVGRFDEALDAIKKAVAEAPNDSLVRATYGRLLGHIGRPQEGIEQVQQAIRMSPDSLPLMYFLGANYRAAGAYDKAIETLVEHRKRLGGKVLPAPTSQLIAAYVQAGRLADARAEVKQLLQRAPDFSTDQAERTHFYQSRDDRDAFINALREAGVSP